MKNKTRFNVIKSTETKIFFVRILKVYSKKSILKFNDEDSDLQPPIEEYLFDKFI